MIDHKSIFSSLKKCNQIGKKLATDGKYILTNGMMIGYKKPDQDETEAVGLGVAFIENKILSKMDALPFMNIEIDGNLLYQTYQDCEFIKFSIDKDNLYIEFKATETEEEFVGFRELALKKGFKEDDINLGISTNFDKTVDIDLYELYINYKKTYKSKTKIVTKNIICKRIYKIGDSKILKKSKKIFTKLEKCNFLGYKELQSEIFDKLINATQPIEFKINLENNEIYSLRLMKSILNGATSKTNCEIRLLGNDDYSYLIVELDVSGFIICNIFRVIKF